MFYTFIQHHIWSLLWLDTATGLRVGWRRPWRTCQVRSGTLTTTSPPTRSRSPSWRTTPSQRRRPGPMLRRGCEHKLVSISLLCCLIPGSHGHISQQAADWQLLELSCDSRQNPFPNTGVKIILERSKRFWEDCTLQQIWFREQSEGQTSSSSGWRGEMFSIWQLSWGRLRVFLK